MSDKEGLKINGKRKYGKGLIITSMVKIRIR